MGTNFYLQSRDGEELPFSHIGKSAFGWCFSLRVYPERGINTLEDWLPFFMQYEIKNEYGTSISVGDMIDRICNIQGNVTEKDIKERYTTPTTLDIHIPIIGPNNLLRSKIDGIHTVGHGEGTYDYCYGDFC